MFGWNGKVLMIDLSKNKSTVREFDADLCLNFLGGRGFAIKILWDNLKPGTSSLSPENLFVAAAGPLTGLPVPSSGKLLVASKSPLTGGYGDGNLGTQVAVELRRAGYDAIVVSGKSRTPCYVHIEDDEVNILNADDMWGLTTVETEEKFKKEHGKDAKMLEIGPAGENLVKYATVISEGRAGGRPGIGAVMGSKNLKAIVVKGTKDIPVASPGELKKLSAEGYANIKEKDSYEFWCKQGTMYTIEWANENSVLPTYNFREGVYDYVEDIDGYFMEKIRVMQRGCPYCNMICGNIVQDSEMGKVKLEYESAAMLGSNIGVKDLSHVAALTRKATEYGMDTISVGNVIGFVMEASEKKLLNEKVEWGDYKHSEELIEKITQRKDIGNLLAEGVNIASKKIKGESWRWAMHVKGLEISAYTCQSAPGMALAYGTSPIGAHHKDGWIISWEVKTDRLGVNVEKVKKLIELQRIRGGFFETFVTCRFPWLEVGLELEWYLKYLKAVTGKAFTLDELFKIADRIYTLIRAFWVRDRSYWSRELDWPPPRWFEQQLTKGPYAGKKLKTEDYDKLLSLYYELRGWDEDGIPRKITLEKLGLNYVAEKLSRVIELH
jgi:aldehyde:ferredoxin oxidoreductase